MIAKALLNLVFFMGVNHAASAGAAMCDALGLCVEPSSGAMFDTELDEDGCKFIQMPRNRDCGREGVDRPSRMNFGTGHTRQECLALCDELASCNYVTYRDGRGDCWAYETCDGVGRQGHERWHKHCPETPYICPFGMHAVSPPVRSDDYFVGTADFGEEGPSEYFPGQLMDIHVRSFNPIKKFLGILIYAVQNNGEIGPEGCESGCDGKDEVKVGEWEVTDANFQTSCGGRAMTHTQAKVKRFHHIFRWKAPLAGSGDVIFRVIVKTGSTNGGWFFWPMEAGDLMLFESGTAPPSTQRWVTGSVGATCAQTCEALNQECDRTVMLDGSTDLYKEIKTSQSCQLPLLSKCSISAPSKDTDGFCYFQQDGAECEETAPVTNICDAVGRAENQFETEHLCPCVTPITTNAPTFIPSGLPTSSPSSGPSLNPSSTPTGPPTSSIPSRLPSSSPSTSHPTYDPTKSPTTGFPSQLPTTDSPSFNPSKAPSFLPTQRPIWIPSDLPIVNLSASPTAFDHTNTPSAVEPTSTPTNTRPTQLPTIQPSKFPTRNPSTVPTNFPSEKLIDSPSQNPTLESTSHASTTTTSSAFVTSSILSIDPTSYPTNNEPSQDPTAMIDISVVSRTTSTSGMSMTTSSIPSLELPTSNENVAVAGQKENNDKKAFDYIFDYAYIFLGATFATICFAFVCTWYLCYFRQTEENQGKPFKDVEMVAEAIKSSANYFSNDGGSQLPTTPSPNTKALNRAWDLYHW